MDSATQPEKINVSDSYWTTILLFTYLNSVKNFKYPACSCRGLKTGNICFYCSLKTLSEVNIEAQKLSREAWIILQKVLQFDIENPTLKVKQVKNFRHLFSYLISYCGLMKSSEVTEEELKNWIETKLPKGNQALLPLISGQATKINSLPSNPKKAEKKKQKAEASLAAAEIKTAQTPKRKSISNQIFNGVAQRQGMFCYWCGIKVVQERKIPIEDRIQSTGKILIYRHKGEIHQDKKATIDHLKRVCEGGTNDLINLVISCLPCNQQRDSERAAHLTETSREENSCPVCRSKFIHSDSKICSICLTDFNQ